MFKKIILVVGFLFLLPLVCNANPIRTSYYVANFEFRDYKGEKIEKPTDWITADEDCFQYKGGIFGRPSIGANGSVYDYFGTIIEKKINGECKRIKYNDELCQIDSNFVHDCLFIVSFAENGEVESIEQIKMPFDWIGFIWSILPFGLVVIIAAAIEAFVVAFFLKDENRFNFKRAQTVFLVNFFSITTFLLVMREIFKSYNFFKDFIYVLTIGELIVIILESIVFLYLFKKLFSKKRIVFAAFAANATTILLSVLIFLVIYKFF